MNREIKFRFWGHFGNYDENDNPVYEMIYGDSFAFEEYAPINELMKETENFKVMQYTGLKDKNGKEIYEYDVLFIRDGQYVVHYSVKWGRWLLVELNGYKDWVLAGEPLNEDVDVFGLNGDESQQSEIIGLLSFKS